MTVYEAEGTCQSGREKIYLFTITSNIYFSLSHSSSVNSLKTVPIAI
jgi:hypothetical protein